MAKTKENIQEIEEVETQKVEGEKVEESVVTFDGKYYYFPPIEVLVDEEGNTETIEIKAQRMFNMTMYNKATYKLQNDGDVTDFANVVFKSMIISPSKAKTPGYFNHDQGALNEIAGIMIDIMGLPAKKLKRNLNLVLK